MKIAVAGIRNYEIRKRLSGKSIKDFHVLYFKAIDFERVQKVLEMKKVKNRNWFNKDPDAEVGCVGYEWIDEEDAVLSVDAAEIVNMRDFSSKALCRPKEHLFLLGAAWMTGQVRKTFAT